MRSRRLSLLAVWSVALVLLLACELPGPPRSTGESALLSPLPTQSAAGESQPGTGPSPSTWPEAWLESALGAPLLLAAVGAVLFVATGLGVYFLVRGRPRKTEQRRVTAQDQPRNTDELPVGTVLDDGQYLVLGTRSISEAGAIYEVKATYPLTICPHCYAPTTGGSKPFCGRCGERFTEPKSEHPVLLARETRDPERFAVSSDLLARNLAHRALIVPLRVFAETSFGAPRYYQIDPDVGGPLASRTGARQPLARVLGWGISLARGLEVLHEHDGALTDAGQLDGVRIDGDEARWLCLEGVRSLSGESDELRSQAVAGNVRDLALLILHLASAGKEKPEARSQNDGRSAEAALKALPGTVGRELAQVLRSHGTLHAGDFAVMLENARRQLVYHEAVRLVVGVKTDVGHVRKLNEDSMLVLDMTTMPEPGKLTIGAFVVADGVGGHAAGDVASHLTVEAIARFGEDLKQAARTGEPLDTEAWLARAARAANEAVGAERAAVANDMGSTLVMALIQGSAATILNVGDSRAYWLRPQEIRQITTDHSLVQRLVEIGQLTPDEARHHPQKSVIYRVIGDNAD
ncbi:MAG: protein phosphatase 2C domain-containing protein, partial [Anaerolineae bacterium]|nr:protein phosphatase 2C domain-containing protein [Anaerolineae bacterium]